MNKLKQDAQKFFNNQVDPQAQNIIKISKPEEWEQHILKSQIPVVLDCYADWCQPCKQLTPKLEAEAKKSKGKWKLVKLNIDEFPQIATALQVKSIPTVFLINQKNAIDGFVGMPDQKKWKTFFETLGKLVGIEDEDSDIKSKIALAETFLEGNQKIKEGLQIIQELMKNEKWKNKYGAKLTCLLALASAQEGNKAKTHEHLKELRTKFSDDLKEDQNIKRQVEICEKILQQRSQASLKDEFVVQTKAKLDQDPSNLALRYQLAEHLFKNTLNEEAIEECLDIIKINRNWENRKAQNLLLKIFEQLGAANSLVIASRKKLSRLLF